MSGTRVLRSRGSVRHPASPGRTRPSGPATRGDSSMFWLVPRPPGHPAPQNGSPRMFRVDWVEKHLSRVKPWQVLIVWVPAIAYLIYRGLQVPGVSRGAVAGALLGGLAFWTLLEYVLHR